MKNNTTENININNFESCLEFKYLGRYNKIIKNKYMFKDSKTYPIINYLKK